jgi:hypothetical protein|nr:MAG TPA: hypothetical protein [Bacteriophage sp.]
MKFKFEENELQLMRKLPISFDPLEDLTGDEILELVEALEDHHGAVAYEAEGELVADILTSIADQGG